MRGLNNYLWVTSAVTDDQAKNSIVLANSLRQSWTNKGTGILVSPTVSPYLRDCLHHDFNHVFILEEDKNTNHLPLEDFAKLSVLNLQAFEKCVYADPNMMVMLNADSAFDFDESLIISNDETLPIFAVKPSIDIHQKIKRTISASGNSTGSLWQSFRRIYKDLDQATQFLDPKFNYKISINEDAENISPVNESEPCIVNFLDDLKQFQWEDLQNGKLGIVEHFAVKSWKKLYAENLPRFSMDSQGRHNISSLKTTPMSTDYKSEPIAIVGMSCRFPGSNNLEEFWNLLYNAEDGTCEPPPYRWLKEQCSRNRPDCRKTNAGFLKVPVDEFDAKFFGISPKEALFMDPQHRLLHELVWEGLEDAGINPLGIRGSNTGVFMGSWTNDFKDILVHAGESEFYRTYMGNSIGAAAARISFLLGLTGPSIATESGCSSAMVAVHLGCKSLQLGETKLAIICGVNLLLHPFDKEEMPMVISPEGRCKTFDAKADGFARAEGCGVLVLKKLSDAVRDNDNIWALVRGTGISQEGISKSMGTPTVHCEALAMTNALRDARVEPHQISYVEAHGTGTVVGDPMEVAAIAKAYSKNRKEPLVIGSVKTNVGHTESCSGITGMIKAVLSMHHETIPPHRNFETLNPAINLAAVPAKIPTEPLPWPKVKGETRYSGVSSFGITGTDAHAILEESPDIQPLRITADVERPLHILKLSAKTEEALTKMVEQYQAHLKTSKDSFPDICHSANTGRADFGFRATLISKSRKDAIAAINGPNFAKNEVASELGKICFLFTGQGSQYHGMAKELYDTSPVFRIHFNHCSKLLRSLYNINIEQVLWTVEDNNNSNLGRTIYSQTSIFCVEYALLKLWESLGVKPDYVIGHSLGEFAAAVCAGLLSVEDALKLVAERSTLIDKLPQGKMLVVKADHQTVDSVMKKFAENDLSKILDFAAINSTQQTVVAGDTDVILGFADYCSKMNIKTIVLESSHAFHSKHMDPIEDSYRKVAATVKMEDKMNCGFISGMRGVVLDAKKMDAEYWVKHTREKVKFLKASKTALELGCTIFIEIGPQPVLSALTMANSSSNILCLGSLKRKEGDWTIFLNSVSKLYLEGVDINWNGLDRLLNRKKVRLPSYPFSGKKIWPDMMAMTGVTIHPLLGSVIPNASSTKLFQCGLNVRTLEYVKDHVIGTNVIFPGAGYLEMCMAAGHAIIEGCTDTLKIPSRSMKLENLSIEAPLCLHESKSSQLQIVGTTGGGNGDEWSDIEITVHRRMETGSGVTKWLSHAKASFSPLPTAEDKHTEFSLDILNSFLAQPGSNSVIIQTYEKLAQIGLKFGPLFQSIENVRFSESGMLAKIKVPSLGSDSTKQQYIVHPVVLDAMIQAVVITDYNDKIKKKLYVPISIKKFVWLATPRGNQIYAYCPHQSTNQENTCVLVDELGTVMATMSGIELVDTTVKAVESVLDQQTTKLPDLWEEAWRGKVGPMQYRIPESVISENVYNEDFMAYVSKVYETCPPEVEDIFTKLEEYVYLYILKCFYECGWKPVVGDRIVLDQFVLQLGIIEEHKKFTGYLLEILEQEQILQYDKEQDTWLVKTMPPPPEVVEVQITLPIYTEDLVQRFDSARLVARVGKSLAGVFKGILNPLQVLFPQDTKNNPSVGGFYDDYGRIFNVAGSIGDVEKRRLTWWLKKLQGQKFLFRVVEIGAGTGVFTDNVLPIMDNLGIDFEYTYTDISPAFFSVAEKRFEKYASRMKFKRLNIEDDPIAQGFIPENYDYAIASDVIHATKDVRHTLKNIRKLLRNRGNLDIMEQIQKNRVTTFLFGVMQGFWRFEDYDLRKTHCILTDSQWATILQECGFENPITFPSFNHRHGLITSWASKEVATIPTGRMPRWLLFSLPGCKLAGYLKDQLALADREVICIEPGKDFQEISCLEYKLRGTHKGDFDQLLSILNGNKMEIEGTVYLWGLDSSRTAQEEILQPYFYLTQLLLSLKQKTTSRLCAVTRGVAPVEDNDLSYYHPSTLWGFTKTMRNENTDMNCRCVSISTKVESLSETELKEVYNEIWNDDKEWQVAYNNGTRHVARFQPVKVSQQSLVLPTGTNRFQLVLPETKSIADLKFGPLEHLKIDAMEIEIQVKASALNFRDIFSVIKPTEEFKNVNAVGFDFAGIVKRVGAEVTKYQVGNPVFGVNVHLNALPSHIKVHQDDVNLVPEEMTLCEAATLPAVFATAYYCLIDVAKIQSKDIVLVHAASGGVGLSAIQILQHFGCTIIATAGSKRKKNYLQSLGIQHIFHSRDTRYGDEILKLTNGHGVDVVLNSLTSEGFKEASLKCCAKAARFVEMSKLSIWTPEEVRKLRPDVDYTIVDISTMEPNEWRRLMFALKEFAEKKVARPIPYVRFDGVNIQEALQYLQKAKHIGKVVCVLPEVKIENGEMRVFTPLFNDRSSYLVTGGLGGIGFEVAKWMVQNGAKHIVLASRRKASSSCQAVIDQLNSQGAHIIPVQLDVGNFEMCEQLLLRDFQRFDWKLPPLRGVMHCAGTLSDGLIVNQDWAKLSSTFSTKINGTINLHQLTKGCALEHFVVFSSIAALFGSPGQSNHAAGNNFEDTFAHYRHSIGLPATTVNWGLWGQVGVATEVDLPGMKALSTLQGISTLEYVLKTQRTQTCALNMESFLLFSKFSTQTTVYLDERVWKSANSGGPSMKIKPDEFWQQYDSKSDKDEKVILLRDQLRYVLRRILKLDDSETIDDDANFQEIGVDSLMFVEIKNALQALLGDRITVSASVLHDCNNIRLLSLQLLRLIEGEDSDNSEGTGQKEILELLKRDCILPETITARGRPPKSIQDIKSVLLTGATGTLGSYVLRELSNTSQIATIYCLIRPRTKEDPQSRLEHVLQTKSILSSVQMVKVICIEGDISVSHLGMDPQTWSHLTTSIDAVFHCAVNSDHVQLYQETDSNQDVRGVNIGGTKTILEFACEGDIKHVYNASSMVSAMSTEADGTLCEKWPEIEDFDDTTNLAYPISKFAGDILMKQAVERGIPCKAFRFPLIAGDSQTGRGPIEQNHAMLRYFFILKHGIMPSSSMPLTMLPVDLCAEVSTKLFFNDRAPHDIYNVAHNQPDTDQQFVELAKKLGYNVSVVELSEFSKKLRDDTHTVYSMLKDLYGSKENNSVLLHTTASTLRKWVGGGENFWVSKKLSKLMPRFYSRLERTIDVLERDLRFAKEEGWFQKLNLASS